jgi:hypothetical protein
MRAMFLGMKLMYMVDGTTPKPPSYIILGLVTRVKDGETKFIFCVRLWKRRF